MAVSTKEKIKNIALTLFADKGYAGTSMSEIAGQVGIKKASLYTHYAGKEELFLSVFDEMARDYENLHDRLIRESEQMDVIDRLYYIFRSYILHYYRNPEIQGFWNQINFFVPSGLHEKYYEKVTIVDNRIAARMIDIFKQAMDKEILRKDDPEKAYMAFRAMCEGLIFWALVVKQFDEEQIEPVWNSLWLGLQRR